MVEAVAQRAERLYEMVVDGAGRDAHHVGYFGVREAVEAAEGEGLALAVGEVCDPRLQASVHGFGLGLGIGERRCAHA